MAGMDDRLLESDVWAPALEKFAGVTHLTLTLYDTNQQIICGPIHPTTLFGLLAPSRFGSGLFAECLQQCLHRRGRVILTTRLGLAALGVPLVLDEQVVGAVVAGYHLLEFPQSIAIHRLALEAELPMARLWEVVRQESPVSRARCLAHGELLYVLGDTLLRETYRTRQQAALSAQLQEANAAKDQFLAMVSHELRGPLNAMLGWARLLRSQTLRDAARDHALETIERNALQQAQLIEDLLDMSRALAGKVPSDRRPLTLRPIVEAAIQSVCPSAEAKRLRMDVQLHDVSGSVAGDPNQLERITLNLLSNAVKFTASDGQIVVRLIQIDDQAELSIADTGEGIKPDFLPCIFEPFRQQDASTTRVHQGLGLGLAITRHLVAWHGGSIRAESPGVGQGATFIVRLPLIDERSRPKNVRGSKTSVQATSDPVPSLNDVRVLVVEDDADTRELLQSVLQGAGAEVTTVGSAAEVFAAIDRQRPDVLVSDIGLPGEDGYTLIQKVRMRPSERGGDIPAIAVTAWAGIADRDRAMSAGYHVHIAKPLDAPTLIRAIAALVNREQARGITLSRPTPER